jgi:hypothetical protein
VQRFRVAMSMATHSKTGPSIALVSLALISQIARRGSFAKNRALGRELSCLSQTSVSPSSGSFLLVARTARREVPYERVILRV